MIAMAVSSSIENDDFDKVMEDVYEVEEYALSLGCETINPSIAARTKLGVELANKYEGNDEEFLENIYNIIGAGVIISESVPAALSIAYYAKDPNKCSILCANLGGDTDTIAAITGSIAEAYYGIDEKAKELVLTYLPDDLKRGITDYTYIVMYRRNERKKAYDKMFNDIKYFKERIKEDTGRPVPMFMFNQPEMSEEVERLINTAHLPEITDKAYIDTLDLHNIEMDSDLYREKAEESGAYLLRAMLTSIVRQEIFNPGAVDKCVDDGTVYVLLEEMKKKNVYR